MGGGGYFPLSLLWEGGGGVGVGGGGPWRRFYLVGSIHPPAPMGATIFAQGNTQRRGERGIQRGGGDTEGGDTEERCVRSVNKR